MERSFLVRRFPHCFWNYSSREDFVKSSRLIYSPSHDAFLVTGDMKAYGKAVDAGFTEANLLNKVPKNSHLSPNEEFWLGLEKTTSAHVDAHYLQQLKYYDELPAEALKNVRIGNGDLGGLQGFLLECKRRWDLQVLSSFLM